MHANSTSGIVVTNPSHFSPLSNDKVDGPMYAAKLWHVSEKDGTSDSFVHGTRVFRVYMKIARLFNLILVWLIVRCDHCTIESCDHIHGCFGSML